MSTLSSLDVAFLSMESVAPMHLGAVLVLGPQASPREIAAALVERAAGEARLRRRVQPTLWPPGGAMWVPDDGFVAERHVRVHQVGSGWDGLVGRLMAEPLDLSGPPWELHVIAGPPDGGSVVLVKLHHALCDGAGALRIGMALLDGARPRADDAPETAGGSQAPTFTVDQAVGAIVDLSRQAGTALGIASDVLRHLRLPAAEDRTNRPTRAHEPANTPERRTEVRTDTRRVVLSRLDMGEVRRVRELTGGTVHDVLLGVLSGALRQWLQSRGAVAEQQAVRALIPVDQRVRAAGGAGANRLSGYLCDLPVAEPDPVRRMLAVRAEMDRNKAAGPNRGPGALGVLADLVPPAVHRVATPVAALYPGLLFDLVVTTVRLPSAVMAIGGAPVREVYPLVPLAPGHQVGVAFTYDREAVHVGLHADGSAQDVEKLSEALHAELVTLAEQTERTDPTDRR